MRSADIDLLVRDAGTFHEERSGTDDPVATSRVRNPDAIPAATGLPKGIIFGAIAALITGSVAIGYYFRPDVTAEEVAIAPPVTPIVPAKEVLDNKTSVQTTPVSAKTETTVQLPSVTAVPPPAKSDIAIAAGPEKAKLVLPPTPPPPTSSSSETKTPEQRVNSIKAKSSPKPVVPRIAKVAEKLPIEVSVKPKPVGTAKAAIPIEPVRKPPLQASKPVVKATVPVPPSPSVAIPKATMKKLVDGPKVARPPAPVKPPRQVAARTVPVKKPGNATVKNSIYYVQFVSVKSRRAANQEWGRLKKRFATLLGPFKPSVQKVSLAKRGTFYRLRAAGFDTGKQARNLCAKVKAAGQGCLVVRR